ncbi:MAG: circularly permuted type 2 ATP-grasp protein [Beijerinckiaceae bacterium]
MNDKQYFDEMGALHASPRSIYARVGEWLKAAPPELLKARRSQAELMFRRIGITFAVYGEADATERLIPFDIIPRLIARSEWAALEKGIVQRVNALNMFLADLYGSRRILQDGVVPSDLIYRNPHFRPEMAGLQAPHGVYVHIAGIDIVRTGQDEFYVLEDNARTPSGVSYMLENREVMLRLMPDLVRQHAIAPVDNYPDSLLAALRSVAPASASREPVAVLLTPGQYNSAYYEHSFLADKMGTELVEGRDLTVEDSIVYMRTTQGLRRVDVIYRRIDDEFLDPLEFRPDSALGVAGLMGAYRAGNVTLANAPGTGVADDKAIYSYMPEIVRYYTGEEAILKNVPTHRCREKEALAYVLDNIRDLVVKEVNGSGGYGMLVGPHADANEIEIFRRKLQENPQNYIAQPTLALSTCPTLASAGFAPRHVDLRPFVLSGANGVKVIPGGLTRVAMREGSLVVNSSQGGGTKDTWIIEDA